jgi:hypothetical protein
MELVMIMMLMKVLGGTLQIFIQPSHRTTFVKHFMATINLRLIEILDDYLLILVLLAGYGNTTSAVNARLQFKYVVWQHR